MSVTMTDRGLGMPGPDDSGDTAMLKSMIEDSNGELDRTHGSTELSSAALKWRSTATLIRTVRVFNYLKEEPSDEVVGEIQRTRSKTLVVKSSSTRAGVEGLSLVEAEAEDEKEDHLKPLAIKYRLAASFLKRLTPLIYKANGTVDTTILDFVDLKVKANKTPVDGFYSNDVVIDAACNVWVRIFAPSESKDLLPVVVYFHGGGFASGSPNSSEYDKLCRKIAKALNAVVISVNYRLTSAARYPTQYEDSFKVLQWIQKTPAGSEFFPASMDISRCFLGGDSAGGNIVHHVGCRAAAADLGPVKIQGWIMLQPFFGGKERTESELTITKPVLLTIALADWFWEAFLPDGATRDHEAASVFGPNAPDISRLPLPPILLAIGTHDILKDREVAYAKEMSTIVGKNNIMAKKYSGGFHGFFSLDLDLQKILMVDIKSFVQGVLANQKS